MKIDCGQFISTLYLVLYVCVIVTEKAFTVPNVLELNIAHYEDLQRFTMISSISTSNILH